MSEVGAEPVAARAAASLIVVRPGPEVLMGLRGAGHRFMPNRLVFPGGAVEPGDATEPAASEPAADTLRHLCRAADPVLARGLVAAAARELEEETGLSLGRPPALAGLSYLCRAVTPPTSPIRFDARFLVVDAGEVDGAIAGSGELEDVRWYGAKEVLGLDLALVTRAVLGQLIEWLDMPEQTRAGRTQTPVFRSRQWAWE